jgi:AraC family transcriptional regulator, transcriptional activator of the genes for pyochelin and ferripyochelin receptors
LPIQLFTESLHHIPLSPTLPHNYTGQVLPGSISYSSDPSLGTILVQIFKGEDFSIQYNFIQLLEKHTLYKINKAEGLHFKISLRNNFLFNIHGIGKMNLKEGQFTAMKSTSINSEVKFDALKSYESFNLTYSPSLIETASQALPGFHNIIKNPIRARWISYSMRNIINELMHCRYDEDTLSFFFEAKLRTYLVELMAQEKKAHSMNSLTGNAKTMEAIRETFHFIISNPDKHVSIRELAKKVQLNEFDLKREFKKMYGLGLFECHQKVRMEKARELLLQTDKPMKAIFAAAGYTHVAAFITAFRKYYGYPPGSLRRG